MDSSQKEKEEEKSTKEVENKAIRNRLASLAIFLNKQSHFSSDNLSWAASCIQAFLDGQKKTLDHAFGIRSSKRGAKLMLEGKHDDWVVAAWHDVIEATPEGKDWPDTKTLAEIGRFFGLGGRDQENAGDHGIASELKRIIERYRPIIVKQLSQQIEDKWLETKG